MRTIFADRWRKLALIQLRHGAVLDDHSARFPITIQALAGNGTLRIGKEAHTLSPGIVVPIDAHVIHAVHAEPAVAILVTFFRQGESASEDDTTARFE